jgi:AcrR family transcriptional regulator
MSALAAASSPRRRLTAARRRRQLIEVALETFALNGYTATTMEEIATAAGVTKPLLYQHFASKRALYLELIDDVTSRLVSSLEQAARSEVVPRRQVDAGMRAYFGFALENQAAMRMLYQAPNDEEISDGLRSIEEAIAQFVTPLIDADIDDDHRRTLAVAVVGMTEGVTREWLAKLAEPRPVASYGALSDADGLLEGGKAEAMLLADRVANLAWGGLRGVRRPGPEAGAERA